MIDLLNVKYESERNSLPSLATFELVNENSVRTRLSEDEQRKMPVNGHNLETLRTMSPLSHLDQIDRVGVATKMLSESAAKYSKSGLHTAFMKQLQTIKKPK